MRGILAPSPASSLLPGLGVGDGCSLTEDDIAWPKGVPRKPSPVPVLVAPQIEWSTVKEQFGRLMIVASRNGKELERWNPNPRYLWRECIERQERHAGV